MDRLRDDALRIASLVAIDGDRLVGHARFGFSAATVAHLDTPYRGDHFMGLELRAGALTRRRPPVPMLDDAALKAVRNWHFAPTLVNGQAVPVRMAVTVNFTTR